MIIGYYQQMFFGGGTYYKLSKKDSEDKYKMEYAQSAVPNYIPNAEEYIKKYDTLEVENEREKEYFDGKIKVDYVSNNIEIEFLNNYIQMCNWEKITKKEYNDKDVPDGICWSFYIEFDNKVYEIDGYEKFPKEIVIVLDSLKTISNKYNEEIVPNKKDIESILKYKNSNIAGMKFLYKEKMIDKKMLKKFINNYKKYK